MTNPRACCYGVEDEHAALACAGDDVRPVTATSPDGEETFFTRWCRECRLTAVADGYLIHEPSDERRALEDELALVERRIARTERFLASGEHSTPGLPRILQEVLAEQRAERVRLLARLEETI